MSEAQLPTVLLVDDEEAILRSLRRALRSEPYRIVTAPHAEAALAWAEGSEPDVVVTDLRMPRIDGLELLRRLLAVRPGVVAILLTGHGDSLGPLGLPGGRPVYRVLAKPWNDEELRVTVLLALRYRELLRENAELRERAERQIAAVRELAAKER